MKQKQVSQQRKKPNMNDQNRTNNNRRKNNRRPGNRKPAKPRVKPKQPKLKRKEELENSLLDTLQQTYDNGTMAEDFTKLNK